MRPPEFTGGNFISLTVGDCVTCASMRPPEFTGGNARCLWTLTGGSQGFNEAAGIHRRKRDTITQKIEGYQTLQ